MMLDMDGVVLSARDESFSSPFRVTSKAFSIVTLLNVYRGISPISSCFR